jgi:hypothetical protein
VSATTIDVGPAPEDVKKPGDDDQRMWSVTTLIGCLDKPALIYWAAEETAKAAVQSLRSVHAMVDEQGADAAVEWLKGARFRRTKGQRTAVELGTAVHAACEQYVITGERPDVDAEVAPFLDRFDAWCDEFQPEYQAAEVTVFSPTYGYAGTCDAFLTVGGVRAIVDYKSTRKSVDAKGNPTSPYPEVSLQLAGYRYADIAAVWRPRRFEKFRRRYYLLSPEERALAVPVPEVDTGLVIHLTPEHCHAYPVKCDEEVFESFLAVIDAARWSFEISKDVIGQPLVKGGLS